VSDPRGWSPDPANANGPPDDERTGNALPAGTQLHEFTIERVIGEGGFGIVYLAVDVHLRRTVAVKEYLPASLSRRANDKSVELISERTRETYDLGLRSFINEAQLLASFDHPGLVKVFRFWEQNGTAYMVMPFLQGTTLKEHLAHLPQPADEGWLKELLVPLLDALEVLHADGCLHRDIAPDNILLSAKTLRPTLLDLGAARRVIGDATQALTVILKNGYAPVEQYAEDSSLTQGTWTDVYALCAVLYFSITGRKPQASVARILRDELVPLSVAAKGRYASTFLAAIDRGLAVRPEARTRDIASLRSDLFSSGSAATDEDATVLRAASVPFDRVAVDIGNSTRDPDPSRRGAARGTRLRFAVWGVASVLLTAVAGALWFTSQKPPAAASGPTAFNSDRSQEAAAPFPTASSPESAPGSPAISAPPTPPQMATGARGEFSVRAFMNELLRLASPTINVSAIAAKDPVIIDREAIQLRVKANRHGYLYVMYNGTGPDGLSLVYPNSVDTNNVIAAGREVTVPQKLVLNASGPPGIDHLLVIVSLSPIDFSQLGKRPAGTISEFDLDRLRQLWRGDLPGTAAFAQVIRCEHGAECPEGFGAALVQIVETVSSK
jgi:serine/threonine protein kinase